MTSLQYPIGLYEPVDQQTKKQLEAWIDELALIPQKYEEAVVPLTDDQLDTPYRPGGWTVRQLIHHVADSHLNAYLRFKLALTEETPHIRPYDQEAFASLPDSKAFYQSIAAVNQQSASPMGHITSRDDRGRFQRCILPSSRSTNGVLI
ncbi:DinB family protein [Bacillus sp. 153480037-1]